MKHCQSLDRPPGDRDNAVGLLRFLLTSMVVLSHSFHMYACSLDYDPMVSLTWGQYTLGRAAVDAFFVLSGFLVAKSWAGSRGWSDFLLRRATRVYPAFFVAVAFSSLVAAPWLAERGGMQRPEPPSWAGIFLPALALDYRELAANGSLWTIRYDFYYYGLIGLIGWTGLLARRWPVFAMWCASWSVYALWFVNGVESGVEDQHPRLLTCFLSGAVAFAYRDRIPLRWTWFAVSMLGLGAYGAGWLTYRQWPYRVMSLAFPVYGAYALLFASFRPGRFAGKLGWLGDYSYGLFLYAYPIQLMMFMAHRDRLNVVAHFLASWAIAIAAARLSLTLIERPAMRLGRRRPTHRREPHAPHFGLAGQKTAAQAEVTT